MLQAEASDIKLVFYSSTRTLNVSDSICVHHQESSTVLTAMIYVIQFMLRAVGITCMTYAYCCMYNTRVLMMDTVTVRNM